MKKLFLLLCLFSLGAHAQTYKVNNLSVGGASTFAVRPVFNGNTPYDSGNLAIANYAPVASPAFTGTVTIPSGASISGYLTTASAAGTYAPLNSPTFTGSPSVPGYLTTASAASTYLSQASAASTYVPLSSIGTMAAQSSSNVAITGGSISGVTVGGSLTGTLPNPTIASGAAASNVGTLGGDLSGTLPNPTVAKVNGVAAASLGLPVSNSASPNATVPVVSYSAATSGTGTNLDLSLVPAGTGAIQAAIPDGTTVGGNKRGPNAADLQTSRTGAAQVASGNYAGLLGGYNNTASGSVSASLAGHDNTASASGAVTLGGYFSTASGVVSSTLGAFATTNGILGQVALGHNSPTLGQYQHTLTQLRASTSSTTATVATADGNSGATSNQLTLRNNSAFRVRLYAIARDATNSTDAKEWTSDILITRGATASTTAIVGSPTVASTFATAGASGWSLAVAADTTNGALKVTVTSSTTDTVRWNIELDAIEVN